MGQLARLPIHLRLGAALDRTIDRGLLGRADDVTALVRSASSGLRQAPGSRLVEQEESFAQVLAPDGAVLDSTPGLRGRRLLSGPSWPVQLGPPSWSTSQPSDSDDPLRLLATPSRSTGDWPWSWSARPPRRGGEPAAAAATRGPIVLVVASLLGHGLAAAGRVDAPRG